MNLKKNVLQFFACPCRCLTNSDVKMTEISKLSSKFTPRGCNKKLYEKNNRLTQCFAFTTNFKPIVKKSAANNTIVSYLR